MILDELIMHLNANGEDQTCASRPHTVFCKECKDIIGAGMEYLLPNNVLMKNILKSTGRVVFHLLEHFHFNPFLNRSQRKVTHSTND